MMFPKQFNTIILPALPKKKRKKSKIPAFGPGFPFYTDYSRTTVANGDVNSPMAQGVESVPMGDMGGDAGGGGMGESVEQINKTSHKYGCVLLKSTPAVFGILSYWVRKYIPQECLHIKEDSGHVGYNDDYHVTVRYGLENEDENKLSELLDGYGPVVLKLNNVNKFDNNPDYDVLYVEVKKTPILSELNKLIEENFKCIELEFDYKPHLTLAFVKKGTCDHLVGNDFFNLISDTISEVCLSKRDGEDHYISLEI